MGLCSAPKGGPSPHQVSTGLPASQVPSQALGFIFLSSPPTASCFPPQSLHLPGWPGPGLGQLVACQKRLPNGAQLTDRNTEVRREGMTCPLVSDQHVSGRISQSQLLLSTPTSHRASRFLHTSLSTPTSHFQRVHSHCQLIHSFIYPTSLSAHLLPPIKVTAGMVGSRCQGRPRPVFGKHSGRAEGAKTLAVFRVLTACHGFCWDPTSHASVESRTL